MQGPIATPVPAAPPQVSPPSSAPAPIAASQPSPQVASPQPSYQTAPTQPSWPQAAPAPASNPWQEALQGLYSTVTPSSQPQAPYWPGTPSAPADQYQVPQQVPAYNPQAMPSAPASPGVAYLPSQQTVAFQAPPAPAPLQVATPSPSSSPAPASDQFLAGLSDASVEVLNHFGPEAPALLNHYACVVEDALVRQAAQTAEAMQRAQQLQGNLANAHTLITAAAEDNAAYHTILSNPELLGQYTNEFFASQQQAQPAAPMQETARDRLAAEVAYGEATGRMLPPRSGGVPVLPTAQPMGFVPGLEPQPAQPPQQALQPQQPEAPVGYQRPQLDVQAPAQTSAQGQTGDFWTTFSHLMDTNPAAGAQFLAQYGTPDMLRSRRLLGE